MVWWIVWAGCGADWACVSEDWVVDSAGQPIEACADTTKRATCEALIGHPTYGGGCGGTFSLGVTDCPDLEITTVGTDQLMKLGVAQPGGVRVGSCGTGTETSTGATGDTARR